MSTRVVILSPVLPSKNPTNAGEKLVYWLAKSLEEQGKLISFIVPASNGNTDKVSEFQSLVLAGRKKFPDKILEQLHKIFHPISSWTPNVDFLIKILLSPEAQKRISEADVIDLQWGSMVLLAPNLSRINPRARIIGTLHDVNYQRLIRRAHWEKSNMKSFLWRAQAQVSHLIENEVVRFLDRLVVLSEKDASFFAPDSSERNKIAVIPPPVFDDAVGNVAPDMREEQPTLLFMGSLYRWENQSAVKWLVDQVMPKVWEELPGVVLRIAGPAPEHVFEGLDQRIHYVGVVDEIADGYRGVWAALAPLKLGAGVKFKTIDALLLGVPVISTYAGIEGVNNVAWATRVAESPQAYSQAIIETLRDIEKSTESAREAKNSACSEYSLELYSKRIKILYNFNVEMN